MIEGAKLKTSYRDLLDILVCDIPGPEALLQILINEINNMPDEIAFKQWVSTERTELITVVQERDEFLESLVEKMMLLKTHHFVSKVQSYLALPKIKRKY